MKKTKNIFFLKTITSISIFLMVTSLSLFAQSSSNNPQNDDVTTLSLREQYMSKCQRIVSKDNENEFKKILEQAVTADDPCAKLFQACLYFSGEKSYNKDSLKAKVLAEGRARTVVKI